MLDNDNIVYLNSKNSTQYMQNARYKFETLPIPIMDEMKYYPLIILEDKNTLEVEKTIFSDFFYTPETINWDINTKVNYANKITLFLNYILIDSSNKINSLEELEIKHINIFFKEYIKGKIGRENKKDRSSVEKVVQIINRFIKWLCLDSELNMKYINKSDFNSKKNIFIVELPRKKKEKKLKKPDSYIIIELLKVALERDPMMAFGIALQSFAGLRCGEVCQMTFDNINIEYRGRTLISCDLDLREEQILRSDSKKTGNIKVLRKQPVYEGFVNIFDKFYRIHKEYIRTKGYDKNLYNAVFVVRGNKAMTDDRYKKRLGRINEYLIEKLEVLARHGDIDAKRWYEKLQKEKITSHTFRYYFTSVVAKYENGNAYVIAAYRGDENINSALTYIKENIKNRDYIREVQDDIKSQYYSIEDAETYINETRKDTKRIANVKDDLNKEYKYTG